MSVIKINASKMRQPQYELSGIEGLSIEAGEQIAIVGENGAGKSILVGILLGRYPLMDGSGVEYDFGDGALSQRVSDNVRYLTFRDSMTILAGGEDYFYQQRWNSTTFDDSPKVRDELPATTVDREPFRERLFEMFGMERLLDKRITLLSSGEMRKFQITKSLLDLPQLLILDNPFIGLDVASRDMLHALLRSIAEEGLVQIVLVLSKVDDIPDFVSHIIELHDRRAFAKRSIAEYYAEATPLPNHILSEELRCRIEQMPVVVDPRCDSEMVAELRGVSIRYGARTILESLDWSVRRGECWALSGENGAGKSTLLSLVCADNPQSYACDISLFGRQRGSGESIWDIKRNIGYVSPEMHRSYNQPVPAIEIVGSGLYDTVGLHRKLSSEQLEVSHLWMEIFGIEQLSQRLFTHLSSGEQRLVLLARAFVKDPALLILDEPLHGLDMRNRKRVIEIIESFCRRASKTLIIVTHYPEELPTTITNKLYLTRKG